MMSDNESPSQSQPERGLQIFSMQHQPGNAWFAEEPDLKEEKAQTWKSQVLISSSKSQYAYLGPIDKTESNEVKAYFPHDKKNPPLIFTKNPDEPYDLNYLDTRVFRATPRINKVEDYIAWLDRMEKHKCNFWKDLGIFNLIQLSRQGHMYQKHMLLAALHLWNSSTSSLHLKCGMLTPTLLDVAAITGLKPTSETFDPSACESVITFDFNKATSGHYIKVQHKPDDKEVLDDEHIAFLTYWLSMFFAQDPFR
jgi:hypothetical protein